MTEEDCKSSLKDKTPVKCLSKKKIVALALKIEWGRCQANLKQENIPQVRCHL